MSVIGSNILAGASGQGGEYTIEESLRFNASQSSYLSWTPASAGNRKTWTWSGWVKYSVIDNGAFNAPIFWASGAGGSTGVSFEQSPNTAHRLFVYNAGVQIETTQVFRDPSSWYHIVAVVDNTQATSSNRTKLYINGVQVTSFTTANYPAQNTDGSVSEVTSHTIGQQTGLSRYFDGYLTEVNFIDGQALDASSFGEFDATTGVWKPKGYTGTYGTNGFYLPMKLDNTTEGFNTVTYLGNGTAQQINGVGFSPDLVWIKARDASATYHQLWDSIRGTSKVLFSNDTLADFTRTDGLTSFNSDGFSVGSHSQNNGSGTQFVAWCWDAGSSTVSNTDGSITSSVRANPTYGFSVVSYTGTGAAASVGHGLGATPSIVIIKDRGAVTSWLVIDNIVSTAGYTILQATDARATLGAGWAPDSTKINLDSASAQINTSGRNYISYCFSEVSGYSKFGSYTGTGAAGNVVTTGFKPAMVVMKCTSTTSNWEIVDNTRSPINPVDENLFPNSSSAEESGNAAEQILFSDTGFTLNTNGRVNQSGQTYIYMAFKDTREYAFWLDDSGNNNDWQPNGGITTSSTVTDTPTPYLGGGNYAVLNPLNSQATVTNGNLTVSKATSGQSFNFATQSIKVPTYFEVSLGTFSGTNNVFFGAGSKGSITDYTTYFGNDSFAWSLVVINGTTIYTRNSGVLSSPITTTTNVSSDVWMCAVNPTTGKIWWGKNGSWFSSGSPSTDANPMFSGLPSELFVCFDVNGASSTQTASPNFGQRPFAYTPPTGFLPLHTGNLTDSSIVDGSKYFDVVTYTGNSSTQSITGLEFQPDLVWLKSRSTTGSPNALFDAVRGVSKFLQSDQTQSELDFSADVTSFDSNGFGLTHSASSNVSNTSGRTYVAWNWKAGGTGVSNTDGSITSTVSANPTAGFSVVTYTGTGATGTVGHGLGVAPKMIICKSRSVSQDWAVYHTSITANSALKLNTTGALFSDIGMWNNTAPTSSVFSLGSSSIHNTSSVTYVAYCFAEVEGYSKFGSYTGNGSADGPFVYTGFRPAFVLTKRTNSTGNWILQDVKRDENTNVKFLYPNLSNAEDTGSLGGIDFLSNGFKVTDTWQDQNASGGTYIYMAFAEHPFKNSLAR